MLSQGEVATFRISLTLNLVLNVNNKRARAEADVLSHDLGVVFTLAHAYGPFCARMWRCYSFRPGVTVSG